MTDQIRLEKVDIRGERAKLRISKLDKPLWLTVQAVHEHRLVDGIVLTASQLAMLQEAAEILAADDSAGRMLAIRAHSIGEIKRKLTLKGYGESAVALAVKKYRSLDLLNDSRFARQLVELTLRKNPAGRSYLIAQLRKKLVPRSIAEQVVDNLIGQSDENELAVQSLRKKWPMIRDLELERARTKAYNYLSRRGIPYGAAKAAFDKLLSEE